MEIPQALSQFHILLVEDNSGDVRLVQEAFKELNPPNPCLHVVDDGAEAMRYLLQKAPYTETPRPDLILLDLNLPKKSGQEVLAEIKSHPNLRQIPVVILTTSQAERDVQICYDLQANCYLTKPSDLDEFFQAIRKFERFWFNTVQLPRG